MSMNFATGPQIGAAIPHKSPITCLSYHDKGAHLFAASEGDSKLYLINTETGKCDQPSFRCEREGISQVSSTHHDHCVIFSNSKGTQHAVQYWSLHDNKILRKFRGHSDTITDMSLCPSEDMFLTASQDRTVRLWNIQQAGCVAQMELPSQTKGPPHVVFDSTGMVFAVMAEMSAGQGNYIHLYDARNYSAGAFSEMQVTTADFQKAMVTHQIVHDPAASAPQSWSSIQFNVSGSQILVQADGLSVILDGYEGTVQRIFQSPSKTRGLASCFASDDQSVLVGTEGGTVDVWNLQSGMPVKTLTGHLGPVGAVASNPKYAQIASACTNTCLWIW